MGNAPANSPSEPVSLREITSENLKPVLRLSVTEEQKKVYPRSNAYSIAEGHYPGDDDPVWIRAIYAGEEPVGFLMTSEVPERGEYFLWRLMIDANHQRKGYGFRAVELLIERIKNSPNPKVLMTSHLKGDGDAGAFYEKLGFVYTGEILNGCDHVMRIVFGEWQNGSSSRNIDLSATP
jgi:diamine N-acetyltransferase